MSAIGFLHTAESHVETFGDLLAELEPARAHVHAVRADLLERARRDGLSDPALIDELHMAIAELDAHHARVVICTCSTLGGLAEECSPDAGVDVLRVDRPMAELAVRRGSTIAVVAALESTLAPTRALLLDAASAAHRDVTVLDAPCLDAWRLFEGGDIAGYHRAVAGSVEALDHVVDVVVLAQASMAGAAALVSRERVVLSSPRTAVEAALRLTSAR